jgi:hypothetical protein
MEAPVQLGHDRGALLVRFAHDHVGIALAASLAQTGKPRAAVKPSEYLTDPTKHVVGAPRFSPRVSGYFLQDPVIADGTGSGGGSLWADPDL